MTLPEEFEKQLVIAECEERSQGNSVLASELLNINAIKYNMALIYHLSSVF